MICELSRLFKQELSCKDVSPLTGCAGETMGGKRPPPPSWKGSADCLFTLWFTAARLPVPVPVARLCSLSTVLSPGRRGVLASCRLDT